MKRQLLHTKGVSNGTDKKEFEELTKRFVNILENATDEKRKEIIKNIPIPELRDELKKIYNIDLESEV